MNSNAPWRSRSGRGEGDHDHDYQEEEQSKSVVEVTSNAIPGKRAYAIKDL